MVRQCTHVVWLPEVQSRPRLRPDRNRWDAVGIRCSELLPKKSAKKPRIRANPERETLSNRRDWAPLGRRLRQAKLGLSQKNLDESNVTRSPGTVNNGTSWTYAKGPQIPESRDIPASSKRWADLCNRRGFSSPYASDRADVGRSGAAPLHDFACGRAIREL